MDYLTNTEKSTGSAENMRSQIQDYIVDAARAKLRTRPRQRTKCCGGSYSAGTAGWRNKEARREER